MGVMRGPWGCVGAARGVWDTHGAEGEVSGVCGEGSRS